MGMWRSLHPFDNASNRPADRRKRSAERRRDVAQSRRARGSQKLSLERFEERCLLSASPELISILSNSGALVYSPNTAGQTTTLQTSPREIDLFFNQGTVIDPTTLNGIQVVSAGADGKLNTPDDLPIQPGFVGIGTTPNEVVLRFAEPLPDNLYQLTLVGTGPLALADSSSPPDLFNSGNPSQPNLQVAFKVDAGPQVTSVVPEPVKFDPATGILKQASNEIDVYFSKGIQSLPQRFGQLDPQLFQLIYTSNTATTADDLVYTPSSVSFDYTTNKATLIFMAGSSPLPLESLGPGTFRLRIGNNQGLPQQSAPVTIAEPGSTFGDSSQPNQAPYDAGILNGNAASQHQLIQTSLGPSNVSLGLSYPGGNYGPGVRNIPIQHHIDTSGAPQPTPTPGTIPTYTYNFPDIYGSVPGNPVLHNVITTAEETLARDIFQLYSYYLGVQFQEVSDETLGAADIGLVTGEVQTVDPTAPASLPAVNGPSSYNGLSGYLAVMNANQFTGASDFGGAWFQTAMQQVGALLGLGMDGEGPPGTIMGLGANNEPATGSPDPATGASPEAVFPGNADILHGQYLYRPESDNVDMYKFTVTSAGQFDAETIAQRLTNPTTGAATPSQLNTVLTLYSQTNVIQLPATGSGQVGGSVVDGATFTINDGVNPPVTFEFAANGRQLTDGNVPIAFSSTDTAHDVAVDVANAINNNVTTTGLDVTANVQFDHVVLGGPIKLTESANQGGVTYSVSRQVISRNDDYFGNDSFVKMQLTPGIYYVAVTSTGNTQFDPNVPGSGQGGTTQGAYDLKLDFAPNAIRSLTDTDGNPLHGNSDGTSGSSYDFWFDVGNTIFVDKTPPKLPQGVPSGPLGSITNAYTTVGQALQAAADRIIAPAGSASTADATGTLHPLDGQTFVINDGNNSPVTFEFAANGRQLTDNNVPVNFNTTDSANQVAQSIVSAIQSSPNPLFVTPVANGNVVDVQSAQFVDASGAPSLLAATKIVRVLGTAAADNSLGVPANVPAGVTAGQSFQITSGSLSAVFEFTTTASAVTNGRLANGHYAVLISAGASSQAIATAMAAAINASPLAQPAGGSLVASLSPTATAWTNGIAWFVNLAAVGLVNINAQATPSLISVSNAQPYLVGHDQFSGAPLADGGDVTVPQGVTMMVDSGAVFKLEGANINVGESSPNINLSGASLQVLGTPSSSVFFTSFHDNTIGTTTDTVTAANPGDWGGIVFGPSADQEANGVFVDSVNGARLTYGGGTVSVNGLQAAYTPIYLDGSRPAITNNTILLSHGAAMSADPNSFTETIFGSPAYDQGTGGGIPLSYVYNTDYERAGPDILGNMLAISQPGAPVINAVAGNQLLDGETFVVINPKTGKQSVFEFASGATAPGQLLADGNFAVQYSAGVPAIAGSGQPAVPPDTAKQVAAEIAAAINAAKIGVTASVPAGTSQVVLSGASSVVPSTPTSFTAPAGASIVDGQTFTVENLATHATVVFEFDNDGKVAAGHTAVTYGLQDTPATVAAEMAAAINASTLGIPAIVSGNQVLLSGATNFRFTNITGGGVTASSSRTLTLSAGSAVTDGSTFEIMNSKTGAMTTFEYHLATDTTPVVAGHLAIAYTLLDQDTDVANETAQAINTANLGVYAVVSGTTVSIVESAVGEFASPLTIKSQVVGNTLNGLFIRTQNAATQLPETLSVPARWTATDIAYILSDNLIVSGNPGGPLDSTPRLSGRLAIDPGATVKLSGARIETQMGASLIAEGTASEPVVFTSLRDDSYGGGGTFDSNGDNFNTAAPPSLPAPGDWSGLYFAPTSHGSLDHALLAYGGGGSTVQGNSDNFNAIEIHQAQVRVADSTIENNATGLASAARPGLEGNDSATIYVLGAQPTIVNNIFQNNAGATISINANSLTSSIVPDLGRSTGPSNQFSQFGDNRGPLVRLNEIGNTLGHAAINGMLVRGGTLDTSSVWDDTDIVHVVQDSIAVPNVDSRGGLMLESTPTESLVVKLSGANAGFTATGTPLDITNRIGGSVQVIGTPGHSVILTALSDTTAGAGLTPDGLPQYDTNNTGVGAAVTSTGSDTPPSFPPSGGQLTVTTTTNATTLTNALLLRPLPQGVTINSTTLIGADTQQGTYINGDGVPLQIPQKGILLTTGDANIPDTNTSPAFTGALGTPGDPRLSALIGGTATNDANELTINFTVDPASGIKSGKFEFQFGSEEFPEFVGSPFNDVVAGFINGDQTTNFLHDSKGNLISINSAFFNIDNSTPPFPLNIEYNGMTSGLVASFPVKPGQNTLTIAIADASDDLLDSGILMTDLHFSTQDVGAGGVGAGGAASGAWKGITLDQYSNDTNVAVVNEAESAYTGGVGSNDTPATAQSLGQLARNLKSGDDTQRLGFTVNGTISPDFPSDIDTYTFKAQPGTQVWLDLGDTGPSLDSVLELVDANGTVLARSDNSLAEANNPALLQQELPGNLALPLASGTLLGGNYDPSIPSLNSTTYDPASLQYPSLRDLNSTNALDAGFRVVLPGNPNSAVPQDYYVRVRSRGTDLNNIHGGLSSGPYQLQVRLQEMEQFAGSTVKYADIRYATNGVDVIGQPGHSPLLGDAGETTDPAHSTDATTPVGTQPDPRPTAQNLGNLLTTDQGATSLAGSLTTGTQVDWYKFNLNYDLAQAIQGFDSGDKTWSTIFDIDYADGLSRANSTISVYDSTGALIYVGRDSNIANDQPTPNSTNGLTDLTHGSAGQLDPYIGSAQLPVGPTRTYYVAISSAATLPQAIDGNFNFGSAGSLVRLEPIDSINRVAEDHIGSEGGETAQSPNNLTALFNGTVDTTNFKPNTPTPAQLQGVQSLNTSAVPLGLGDVVLFVDQGGVNGHLQTVNPFAGGVVTDIGATPGTGGGYGDIAMRNDGKLYSLTIGPPAAPTDANSGRYDLIDTGTAAATAIGSDGITTYQFNNATPPAIVAENIGVQIHAMAYLQSGTTRELFVVGSFNGGNGSPAFLNGFYQLNPDTGAVVYPLQNPPLTPTNPLPRLLSPAGVGANEEITGMAVINGTLYAVTNLGGLYVVNDPLGAPSLQFVTTVTDPNGNALSFTALTNGPPDVSNGQYAGDLFATDATGTLWAFNTNGTLMPIFAGGATSVSLGTTSVVGLAFSTLDYNLWHVTEQRGADPGHGINAAPDESRDPSSANSPQAGNLSYYFGLENPAAPTTIDQALNTSLQPGAANYATNAGLYNTYNLPGGALGSLATNSFSLANYTPGDLPTLYFNYFLDTGIANESPAAWKSSARVMISTDGGKTWDEVATNNPSQAAYNLARDPLTGSLGSRQNTQGSELPSFLSSSAGAAVTSLGGKPVVDPRQQVQELFDSSGSWRQARIDLSNYAGQSNLMLRFDFSTAGSLNKGLPGDQFGNFTSPTRGQNNSHEGFYVDDVTVGFAERGEMVTGSSANTQFFQLPQSTNPNAPTQTLTGPYQLEIRRGTEYGVTVNPTTPDIALVHSYDTNDSEANGFTIVAPPASAVSDGQTFTISDGVHTAVFEFDSDPTAGGAPTVAAGHFAVEFQPSFTAAQMAHAIATAINSNTLLKGVSAGEVDNTINGALVATGNRVNIFGAASVSSVNAVTNQLAVSVASHVITEQGGSAAGQTQVTVTRSGSAASTLAVTLSAIDLVTGTASQNVTLGNSGSNSITIFIPAGQASATVTVHGVEQFLPGSTNEVADGTQTVEIIATAQNYNSVTDTVDVTDAPGVFPTFTVTLAAQSIVENAGPAATTGTVTINTGPVDPAQYPTGLIVNLQSLDPSSATVPATVTILPGDTSATFPVNAIDDNILRTTPVNVTILATHTGFVGGSSVIAVQDDGDLNQAPLTVPAWAPRGPTSIQTGFAATSPENISPGDPEEGAIETVLADPTNANILYIGAVNGGIWKTTNAQDPNGPTWQPLSDNLPSQSMGAMAFDRSDPKFQTIIAGFGDFSSIQYIQPNRKNFIGLVKTTDGGQTWTQLTQTASSPINLQGQSISAVAENGNMILAGSRDFVIGGPTDGLFRSTDGGSTFSLVSSQANSGLPAGPVSDIVEDPTNLSRFYAAVLGSGLYRSDDNGATWTNITPPGITFNAAPALFDKMRISLNGPVVWYGYEQATFDPNGNYLGTFLNGIYRSPDMGVTWAALGQPTTVENGQTVGLNFVGQGNLHFSMVADPTNPNVVYVGGDGEPFPYPNSVGANTESGRLFRGDASKTPVVWSPITNIGTANDSSPHTDSRRLVFNAAGDLIETDDGGIYQQTHPQDSTGIWQSLIGQNLQITELHDVAYDSDSNTLIGGAQDNNTSSPPLSNGLVWNAVVGGDGGDVAVDDSNPGQSLRYGSAEFLQDFTKFTYDTNNNLLSAVNPTLIVAGTNGQSLLQVDPLEFITPVVLNAINPSRMVIGGVNSVYESFDQGNNVTNLGAGGIGGNFLERQAMAYGGMLNGQANPDVLWVGVDKQVLLRTSAGGALTPTNYRSNGQAIVQALVIDPNNWRTAYVADSSDHIFLTQNAGANYIDITGNLATLTTDFHALAYVPGKTANLLYVGTRDGVYVTNTNDPSHTWSRYGAFMPHVQVYDLQYVPSQQLLVAGTLGRGAFTTSAIGAAGDIIASINQATVSDDGGVITGTISRSGTFGDQIVTVTSSDPALIPSFSLTIPNGSKSASFSENVNDLLTATGDDLANLPETLVLKPSAAGLISTSAYVNVLDDGVSVPDDDAPALTVTIAAPDEISQGAGPAAIRATVTRNTPTTDPVTVTLISSDNSQAQPSVTTVTIPAGQTSATFTIDAIDQFSNDGLVHAVTITAASNGYLAGRATLLVQPSQHVLAYNRVGDSNVTRTQGQTIIQQSKISNSLDFGVLVEPGPRDAGGSLPHPGVPINFQPLNTARLAPGATIENNLLVGNGQGGVSFAGDPNTGTNPPAAVPYGRVLNNTIYGGSQPQGTGVTVGANASPTILNNIFANLATGVSVDPSSSSTVLEGSVYQNNGTNLTGAVANGGDLFSYSLSPTDALFVNPAANDFYLLPGSKAIDSAINSLTDRPNLTPVKNAAGIAPSPVNAPSTDLYGQLRTANPQTNPSGVGSTLFKDRGAIEAVDFTPPIATLVTPRDNDANDQDPAINVVHDVGVTLNNFAIQLSDGNGVGIDNSTVSSSKFDLYRNGARLIDGIDYFFSYDTNTNTAYFTPATGTWQKGNQYTIFVDNGVKFDPFSSAAPVGIKDLAGNLLQANSSSGYTRYDIMVQNAGGDAPSIGVPGLQSTLENTPLVFSSLNATPNPITFFNIDAPSNPVTVTLHTDQGTLTLANLNGLTNVTGNGTATLSFTGTVNNINTDLNGQAAQGGQPALAGLTFTPTNDFRSPPSALITITATDPKTSLTGTNQVIVNVIPVNQPPVVHVPPPQSVAENPNQALVITPSVTITDPDAGTGAEQVTINVPNGTVRLSQTTGLTFTQGGGVGNSMVFSGTLADINAALNGMSFLPSNNFAGQTTISISVNDQGNSGNAPDGSPGPFARTGSGSVVINVAPVDQPPDIIQPLPHVVHDEVNVPGVTTVIDLSQYISDPDINNNPPEAYPTLSITGNSNPNVVTATINGHILTLTYVPYGRGDVTISIQALDAGPSHFSLTAQLLVTVNPINYPPVASNSEYLYTPSNPSTPLVVTAPGVLANAVDHDANPISAVLFNVPSHGKLVLNSDGSFTYIPDPGFNGRDSFVYNVVDQFGHRVPATVYLDSLDSRWVARMYSEVLGRTTDPANSEVNYWVGQLNKGETRQQVADFFVTSPERRGHIINQLYEQYLGRAVDQAGLNFWLGVWNANQGPEQVQAGIIGSPEYFATAGGTPAAWVTKLYQNLLDRDPGPSEVAYWTGYIQSHSRASVVLGFVTSDEYRLNLLRGIPGDPNQVGWYEQYLHRPIDESGAMYWLAQMKAGYPQEAILEGILASDEYLKRA